MENHISEKSKDSNEFDIEKAKLFQQFDESGQVSGIYSFKWEYLTKKHPERPEFYPLWVADMDYPVAEIIKTALSNLVSKSHFGYTFCADDYYKAVIDWYSTYHQIEFKKEEIYKYSSRALLAIGLIMQTFSEVGDKILLLTPVYYMFFESIKANERELLESPLIYKDRSFFIDFADFEEKVIKNKPKIFFFSNPHNPVGRVWTKEEICKLHEICLKNNVIFVSDEVFSEIVFAENKYIQPFIPPYENNTIMIGSLGKNFNLNGIETCYCIIRSPELREKFTKGARKLSLFKTDGNIFSHLVTIAAYSKEGKFWVDCVREYIYENYKMMDKFFEENFNEIVPIKLEGSFVLLCDYSKLDISEDDFFKKCEEEDIIISKGSPFHIPTKMFRINIACSRKLLREALEKIKEIFKDKKI